MKNILRITILIAVVFFQSCEENIMHSTEVSYTDYKNGDKQMRFVDMHHIGKKEFFKNVAKTITEAKKKDYVLFYEWSEIEGTSDIEKRKIRKLIGFVPSNEGYENILKEMGDKTLMVQDDAMFLNLVNKKDFNVDLTMQEIVEAYESKYGEIKLTKTDLTTPLLESVEHTEPESKTLTIVLDKRNAHLANKIEKSPYKKIIVIYGSDHKAGVFKELKTLNSNWIKSE